MTRCKNFHIFLNPHSGQQKSRQIWQKIEGLFTQYNFNYSLTETIDPNQAQSVIQNLDLTHLDGMISLGGDGTLYTLINGLMGRPDWETAIKIPMGIIPTGTSNGLAKTLLEISGKPDNIEAAIDLIFRGQTQPLDLVKIQQNNRVYYSLLSIAWGLISDVDIESEALRFLGQIRTDIYALLRIINLRKYPGQFSFLPLDSDQWQTIKTDFILIWAMNVPWVDSTMKAAPHVRINDGTLQVLIVRSGIGRLQLLSAFLKLATGDHLSCTQIESYRVRGFRLEPLTATGILAVDGEKIEYAPIQVEVLPGLGRVFCG